jgi:hypothetical protein
MTRGRFLGIPLITLSIATSNSSAQNSGIYSNRQTLNAFGADGPFVISIFADSSEASWGSSRSAFVNFIDFSNGFQFSQCTTDQFNITVNPGMAVLSFITEGEGFNCPTGLAVSASCEPTSLSSTFRDVTNGIAQVPGGLQFTTHGLSNRYNNLQCVVSAFGVEIVGVQGGNASNERTRSTP